MIELPFVTIFVVTAAAIMYCAKAAYEMAEEYTKFRANQKLKELQKLQDTAREEIETDFDFWWNGGPSGKIKDSIEDNPLVPEVVATPLLKECRNSALHLAVHARLGNKEEQLISELPSSIRDEAFELHNQHTRKLEDNRTQLIQIGISIEELDELEARFAPSN